MKKLHFETSIDAPVAKVWSTMLDDATYRQWTSAFSEGSYYEGSWEKGSKIRFLGPGGSGGMVATIAENRLHEFLSIKHLGVVKDGVEDTESEEARKWAPAFENYTFTAQGGKTHLAVDMDCEETHAPMFQTMWPNALASLKQLAEG